MNRRSAGARSSSEQFLKRCNLKDDWHTPPKFRATTRVAPPKIKGHTPQHYGSHPPKIKGHMPLAGLMVTFQRVLFLLLGCFLYFCFFLGGEAFFRALSMSGGPHKSWGPWGPAGASLGPLGAPLGPRSTVRPPPCPGSEAGAAVVLLLRSAMTDAGQRIHGPSVGTTSPHVC